MSNGKTFEQEVLDASHRTEVQLERALVVASDMLGRQATPEDPLVGSVLIAIAINQQTISAEAIALGRGA